MESLPGLPIDVICEYLDDIDLRQLSRVYLDIVEAYIRRTTGETLVSMWLRVKNLEVTVRQLDQDFSSLLNRF